MTKPLTALTLASLLSLPSLAQTSFSPEKILFRNNEPGKTLLADLDADTDLDLVLTGSAGIFTFENTDGAGTLGPPNFVGIGRADFVADVDGDTKPDLVVIYPPSPISTTRVLAWHRNLGSATSFSESIVVKTGERATTLFAPVNVDGDADLDFVWLDGSNDLLEWSENTDGTGTTWATPVSLLTSINIINAHLVDINGDLILDLVGQDWKGTGNANDDDVVYFPGQNTTPLSFGASTTLLATTRLLTVANLDGDSDVDLITPSSTFGGVDWRANNGTATFGAAQPIVSGLDDEPENINIVDLNDDNDPDFVFTVFFEDVSWAENNGGSFAAPVSIGTPTETFDNVSVGDLTGDDDPDIITSEDFALLLHTNNNDASSFGPPVFLLEAIDWLNDIDASDLDGDSYPELVFATRDGKLFCIPNLGDGFFDPANKIMTGLGEIAEIGLTQIDGSGGPDLFTLSTQDNTLRWHEGTAPHVFGPATDIDTSPDVPQSLAWDDLDGNGSVDLAVALNGDSDVGLYSQNPATHAFSKSTLPGTLASVRAVAIGEIDGNPGLDIVAITPFSENKVYLSTNTNGMGAFSTPLEVGIMPGSVAGVKIANMDGDGDLDIIAFESDGARSNVVWFPNDGTGSFGPGNLVYDVSAGVRDLAVGDLDNDGDMDFVTANSNSDQSRWHENDGNGVFPVSGEALDSDPASSPYNILLSDIDNDGDLDVVNSSRFDGIVGWFENQFGETPLIMWAKKFGLRDAELDSCADTDGDSVKLFEEFAYNMNPTVSDRFIMDDSGGTGLPNQWFTISATGAVRAHGRFVRRRDWADVGLTYTIERTQDFVTWFTLAPGSASTIDNDYQRVSYNRSVTGKPKSHYQRLRVDYTPPAP